MPQRMPYYKPVEQENTPNRQVFREYSDVQRWAGNQPHIGHLARSILQFCASHYNVHSGFSRLSPAKIREAHGITQETRNSYSRAIKELEVADLMKVGGPRNARMFFFNIGHKAVPKSERPKSAPAIKIDFKKGDSAPLMSTSGRQTQKECRHEVDKERDFVDLMSPLYKESIKDSYKDGPRSQAAGPSLSKEGNATPSATPREYAILPYPKDQYPDLSDEMIEANREALDHYCSRTGWPAARRVYELSGVAA